MESRMYDIRKIQEQVLYEAVKAAGSDVVAKEIVYGKDGAATAEDDPTWVKSTMRRMEEQFDGAQLKAIRMNCQCGYGMEEKRELVKGLMKSASSLREFGSSDEARTAGLFYENGDLYLQFLFCPCPMLAQVDHLETMSWCQCTTGYSKVLFEQAFGCAVDVELLESIKAGNDRCLMKIIPAEDVWK